MNDGVTTGFADELEKLGRKMPRYRDLAAIGAGTGAMLNLGARGKAQLGMDYHPEQKGRTFTGDATKGALAAMAAGALLKALSRGKAS